MDERWSQYFEMKRRKKKKLLSHRKTFTLWNGRANWELSMPTELVQASLVDFGLRPAASQQPIILGRVLAIASSFNLTWTENFHLAYDMFILPHKMNAITKASLCRSALFRNFSLSTYLP